MLEFVISTILSGIIWDVIKGSQKLLYHYSLKKMNIAEAELTNLIENIPQEEKNNKKLVIEYLKEDSEYQILLKQAVRNVRSANLKKTHDGYCVSCDYCIGSRSLLFRCNGWTIPFFFK